MKIKRRKLPLCYVEICIHNCKDSPQGGGFISQPLINCAANYSDLFSFLAFSIIGHSWFLHSLSSLERSSANLRSMSHRKWDVWTAFNTASLQTCEENRRIIPLGLESFSPVVQRTVHAIRALNKLIAGHFDKSQ